MRLSRREQRELRQKKWARFLERYPSYRTSILYRGAEPVIRLVGSGNTFRFAVSEGRIQLPARRSSRQISGYPQRSLADSRGAVGTQQHCPIALVARRVSLPCQADPHAVRTHLLQRRPSEGSRGCAQAVPRNAWGTRRVILPYFLTVRIWETFER